MKDSGVVLPGTADRCGFGTLSIMVPARLELPPSRWVDVGGPVHYREWPGPDGPPTLVCVHGLGGSLLNWGRVAPSLARHGRVVALDLAGFGMTPPEGRGGGVSSNWRLLDGFIRALDLAPAILFGNSMGGMLCLIQAAHTPRSVHAMVLVDAAFPRGRTVSSQPTPWLAAAFALYSSHRVGEQVIRARARRLGAERLVRRTFELCTADPGSLDPALVDAHIELARRRQTFEYAVRSFGEAARSIYRSQARPGRYRAVVRAASAPALVIHGARDRLVPLAAAREAVAEHENWELVVLDDLGHLPMMEAPDRFSAIVQDWLERSPGPAREGGPEVGVATRRPPSGAP
jgi:pimeloyl-ACP methyl ester carboxylesterase